MSSQSKVPPVVALDTEHSSAAAVSSSIAKLRSASISDTVIAATEALSDVTKCTLYKANTHLAAASLPNIEICTSNTKFNSLTVCPEPIQPQAQIPCPRPASVQNRRSRKEFVSFLELGAENIDLVTHALEGLGCDSILWLPPLEDETPISNSMDDTLENDAFEEDMHSHSAAPMLSPQTLQASSNEKGAGASASSPSPSTSPTPSAPQAACSVHKQKSKTSKFFSFFKFSKRNSSSSGSDAENKRSDPAASEASDAGFFSEEDFYNKKTFSGRKRLFHFGYLDSLHHHAQGAAQVSSSAPCTSCVSEAHSPDQESDTLTKSIPSPPAVFNNRCPDLSEEEHASIPPNIKLAPLMGLNPAFKFNHGKVLGKGASGTVRMTKSPCCSSVYAIKEFRKRKRSESPKDYIKKVTSEFSIGTRLRHQNIVEMIDIIKEGSHWYEVMEYCSGGDLYSIIKSDHMSVEDIDCIFKQLIYGVHYMHSNGVAHRDLKPENLLIDISGHVKICDFGISMRFFADALPEGNTAPISSSFSAHLPLSPDTEDNGTKVISKCRGLCGSSPYIAPEEFSDCEYDARAVDVWSCAIVYYAMTFHGVPWESATSADPNYVFYLNNRRLTAEPLVRLPSGPQHLLSKMLEPDPAKRITIEEIMQDEWFQQIKVCVPYGHPPLDGIDEFEPEVIHNHFVNLSVRKKQLCAPDHIP